MRRRPVVAPWRTSAALALVALVALVAGGCGQAASSDTESKATAARPQLASVQQQPLMVKGTGFRPAELVHLSAKGLQSSGATAAADESGEFVATFHGLESCDSVTVVAVGSEGSRAELNLSQLACVDG